jgi:Protein of unknown function (DUF4232)
MIHGFRRTAAVAAAVVALGAGGAAWAASSASAAPAAIGPCAANNLVIWVTTGGDSVSGTTYLHLDFSNRGRSACSLDGYPVVTATTLTQMRLGAAAGHGTGAPATTIDLAPGATAHSILGYVAKNVGAACKPKDASQLKVYPPKSAGAKFAFFPLPVCTTGRYDLNVRVVQPGY